MAPVHTATGTYTVKRRALLFHFDWWSDLGAVNQDMWGCRYNGPVDMPDSCHPGGEIPACPDGPGPPIGNPSGGTTPARKTHRGFEPGCGMMPTPSAGGACTVTGRLHDS